MIGALIDLVALTSQRIDLQKQVRGMPGEDTQGFEITGPRGFDMNSLSPIFYDQWIDAELVGTGMQTQFIGSKVVCDSSMFGKFRLQHIQIPDVVYTFFEAT